MQSWAIGIVIKFVLQKLATFTTSLDWEKVKSDLDEHIRRLVPGSFFDNAAVSIVNTALDTIKTILSDGVKIKPILQFLAEEKFADAEHLLLDLLRSHLEGIPLCDAQCKVRNLLHEVKI